MTASGLRAVVVPHPPLLVPELTGPGATDAEPLRSACSAAVSALLATGRDEFVVVGPGVVTRSHPADARGTVGGYGVAVAAPVAASGPAVLPLSLTIGRYLLDQAGFSGARVLDLHEVAATEGTEGCRRLGAALAARRPDAGWLVLGDATARRTARAPGAFDPRAEPFDAEVGAAFAAGEPGRLLTLDPVLGDELGVGGRVAWQVLAGAWEVLGGGRAASAEVAYADAPFGVGYFVVRWSDPADPADPA